MLCLIQTTVGRQTRTMWVLDMCFCWAASLLMTRLRWCGAEGMAPLRPSPLTWRSETGCCGSYLWRCLIMEPTSVRKGTKTKLKQQPLEASCFLTSKNSWVVGLDFSVDRKYATSGKIHGITAFSGSLQWDMPQTIIFQDYNLLVLGNNNTVN